MASQTKTSDYTPMFAMAPIMRLIFGSIDVKDNEVVNHTFPATYLAAVHEVTAVALIVGEVLPILIGELTHGAEVGIASVSMILSSFQVGLAWRYWWLNTARSKVMAAPETTASRIKKLSVIILALSSNLFCCVWLIPKETTPSLPEGLAVSTFRGIGTVILCLYVTILYGAYLGNLLDAHDTSGSEAIKAKDKVFAGIYGVFMVLVLCAHGIDSEVFLSVAVVVYAVCLSLVYNFTPPEQPVVITLDVASTSEEIEVVQQTSTQSHRSVNCPRFLAVSLSCVRLLNAPIEDGLIRPRLYLGSTHEVFGITLILTWGLTLAIPILRTQIFDHPAQVIIGSYNPCFGWDYFPASWIAVYCCAFNVYFGFRYSWLASARRQLLRGAGEATWASTFSTSASYGLSISSNLWVCLWILGRNPKDPLGDLDGPEIFWWSVHTGIFVFMAGAEYLTYLGLVLDISMSPRRESVTTKQKVFAAIYGFCCAYLLIVYGLNLAFHDKGSGVPALGSGFWTQVADIMWMACIVGISNFLPVEPPLRQKIEVLQTRLSLDQKPEAGASASQSGSSGDPEATSPVEKAAEASED